MKIGQAVATYVRELEQVAEHAYTARAAQRAYFKSRSQDDLLLAKSAEAKLDFALARLTLTHTEIVTDLGVG